MIADFMTENRKPNILSLSASSAKAFLLKEESYFTFDLPPYFTFEKLLNSISEKLNEHALSNYYKQASHGPLKPSDFEDINYRLMNNKNGKYAWRLFQLIHPAIYVSLVHSITSEQHWNTIQDRFKKKSCVECISIPVISQSEKSDKEEQVIHWWEEAEQRSIVMALDYEYIFHTDISDCYSSIYTHSIAWALHTRPEAKQNRRNNNLCGNVIDYHLQSMSHGQTNGIPQGSVLMDFIAEIVLSYADELLTNKLSSVGESNFRILRYRDDYRIFVNNPQRGEEIIKHLTEVLASLGMQLNAQKTLCSNDVIRNSIKPDKLYEVSNNKRWTNIQAELLNIKCLAQAFPNSGSLSRRLQSLYRKINVKVPSKYNPEVLISIVVDLAFHNPRTYPTVAAILSKMITFLADEKARKTLMIKIKERFKKIPNTEHMDLWLQRITLKSFRDITYEGKLCRLVSGDLSISVWNSDWLNNGVTDIISSIPIINIDKIERLDRVVQPEEFSLFNY